MEITPKMVMALRAATGLPMMKCKQAREAVGGDPEKALETMAREELGFDPEEMGGSAFHAAGASFALFLVGEGKNRIHRHAAT